MPTDLLAAIEKRRIAAKKEAADPNSVFDPHPFYCMPFLNLPFGGVSSIRVGIGSHGDHGRGLVRIHVS